MSPEGGEGSGREGRNPEACGIKKSGELKTVNGFQSTEMAEPNTKKAKCIKGSELVDQYGEWKKVPGLEHIWASSLGCIKHNGQIRKGYVKDDGYIAVKIDRKQYLSHVLICSAFHGPRPVGCTVDHKNHKRGDNRRENLKWSTAQLQNANRKRSRANSHGKKVWVWKEGEERKMYKSLTKAAEMLGLNKGNLSSVANGNVSHTGGYFAEWAAVETNDGEKWKNGNPDLRVSNFGRIQSKHGANSWSHPRYPVPEANGYCRVFSGKKHYSVHVLVGDLFFVGPKPLDWKVWDHKDRNRSNNHISNLRPVSVATNNLAN